MLGVDPPRRAWRPLASQELLHPRSTKVFRVAVCPATMQCSYKKKSRGSLSQKLSAPWSILVGTLVRFLFQSLRALVGVSSWI
jgi:hypothetical protein